MKEINLGRVLVENRHKHGVTQDELAAYMGVSKAAVSKWETGTTYPDITLLPQLAAYFSISIDELMGYEPQMEKAEIRKWYDQLAREFATIPFDEAVEHCRKMAKKYYSCYPLLLHIGSLLVNHSMLAGTPEKTGQILQEAKELFLRVKNGTDAPSISKEALQMEAYCWLALGKPAEVLNLLNEDMDELEIGPTEPLLASAYQMSGNTTQAKQILQIGIYKEIISFCGFFSSYLRLSLDDPIKFEEICARFLSIADIFHLDVLHPGILLPCYLTIAQGWAAQGEVEKALQILEKYTNLATGDIYPLQLHGDSFFDLLDEWFQEVPMLGTYPLREESVIRHSMTQALEENPAFANFEKDHRFQEMVSRLKRNEEGI